MPQPVPSPGRSIGVEETPTCLKLCFFLVAVCETSAEGVGAVALREAEGNTVYSAVGARAGTEGTLEGELQLVIFRKVMPSPSVTEMDVIFALLRNF